MIRQGRKPGVSFILRVRNEEDLLKLSLAALKKVTIPHEIVVICHLCTDGSRQVAEDAKRGGQPIRIYDYTFPISRAGYETLITPVNHPCSLAYYYNWCFSHAEYNWMFKWDADFEASPELIEFLNTELILDEKTPIRYHIPCEMEPGVVNPENYLYNCLVGFKKYIFWECPSFKQGAQQKSIQAKIQTIPCTVLKPYWRLPAWFDGKDEQLSDLLKKVVEMCGPEPPGASRAQCKDCDPLYFNVTRNQEKLKGLGIQLIA